MLHLISHISMLPPPHLEIQIAPNLLTTAKFRNFQNRLV